ncbi:hypothetical protein [Burkholderia cenocepacia]|uniref:hypothetical protein n=1 Tax=Burkholderia cenocepacia TaxID=95486 RepID=UPI0028670EB6|nr:hypothetical protein [Burkholderia cenocepacia]MDR5660986.1 hypothetical protein [Burkholderia cenocepacia]MDR8094144.1 hypothetical protein [Burkholderia cenocepacia]
MEPIIKGSESPMIAENINKPTLVVFENMSHTTVWIGLRNISRIRDSTACSTTFTASATHKAGADAAEISLSERLKRAGPPEVAGKLR